MATPVRAWPLARGRLARVAPAAAASPETAPAARLETFADVVALAGAHRELKLKHDLETVVRLIAFEPGRIEIAVTDHAPPGLAGELSKKLEAWTGTRWMIAVARDGGGATIAETRRRAQEQMVDDARADPLVAAVLERFPGAEIVDVRVRGDAGPPSDEGLPPLPDETTSDEDD